MVDEKIDVNYDKLKQFLSPDMRKRQNDIYSVETRYTIIMSIANMGSSNLKRLSRLLDKSEATILHHVRNLLDEENGPPMLEFDAKMTMKHKGKYYKLTDDAKKLFSEPESEELQEKMVKAMDKILAQKDEEISQILIKMVGNIPDSEIQGDKERKLLVYNNMLTQMMISNLEQALIALSKGKAPKNKKYPLGSLSNYNLNLRVSKTRHLFELLRLYAEFSIGFNELKQKIKDEMDSDNIPEEERILLRSNIVIGEIHEFEFE